MRCPKCKNEILKLMELERGLPAMGCSRCEGTLLPLPSYRDWVGSGMTDVSETQPIGELKTDVDVKTAISCPKCSRIMTKYSMSVLTGTRLDFCSRCDETWLDRGEWKLIKMLKLTSYLSSVFTEQWQRNIREEKIKLDKIARLRTVIGEGDTKRALKVKQWLNASPHKSLIIRFLSAE